MTRKGTYVHRTTVRSLTDNEVTDILEIKAREKFYIVFSEKLGETSKPTDLSEESLDADTPHNPLYDDDDGGGHNISLSVRT